MPTDSSRSDSEIRATVAPGHEIIGAHRTPLAELGSWRYRCSCGELADATTEETQQHLDELRLPLVLEP